MNDEKLKMQLLVVGKPTVNNRIYPLDVIQKAIDEFNQKDFRPVTMGRFIDDKPHLKDVMGTADLLVEDDFVIAEIELLSTEKGKLFADMR